MGAGKSGHGSSSDFLELSTVADLDEARARQSAFVDHVHSLGLAVDPASETDRVLEHLVVRALDAG